MSTAPTGQTFFDNGFGDTVGAVRAALAGAAAEARAALDFLPPSLRLELVALGLALLGAFVAWAALRLIDRLARRAFRRKRAHLGLRLVARRLRRPLKVALVLAALLAAGTVQPSTTGVTEILVDLAPAIAIAIGGWALMAAIHAWADLAERRWRMDVEDNLFARKQRTQFTVLRWTSQILVTLITLGAMALTVPAVRDVAPSLFASAGVAGVVLGIAARPLLSNLIAGVQIALTQPIRLEDAVVIEGEWGWIEEIHSTYVIVRIWDWRRLIIPLAHFVERPFENWTREQGNILGAVHWHVDYTAPVQAIRDKVREVAEASELWDGRAVVLQVIDATPETLELRALVSARTAPRSWDLRCEVREKIAVWLQAEHPDALPRTRAELRSSGVLEPRPVAEAEVPAERLPRGPEAANPPDPRAADAETDAPAPMTGDDRAATEPAEGQDALPLDEGRRRVAKSEI